MFLLPPNETQIETIKKDVSYQSADRVEEDVTQLVEWLTKQPHLPNITDRKWLSHFIISCKYNLQKSKKVIESYFIVRAEYPEFFGPIIKEELTEVMKNGGIYLFPKLTPEGYRVICTTTNPTTDDTKYDTALIITLNLAILDLQLNMESMYGSIYLFDLKHFRLSQFLTYTPTITKNMLKCVIESFPLRVKAVHCINPPKFIIRILTFFKMFLPNKIKGRIFVHDSLETLFEYIPKDILPDVYGGEGGSAKKYLRDTADFVLMNNDWLLARPKADLSKRPDYMKSDKLDMNGTFKQLQID